MNLINRRSAGILALAALSLFVIRSTHAEDAITSMTDGYFITPNSGPDVGGYQFTLSQPITVTAFGFWDQYSAGAMTSWGPGLQNNHATGIWTIDGVLMGSGIVPKGTQTVLDNNFRYSDLATPFSLAAGTYRIGAVIYSAQVDGYADYVAIDRTVTTSPVVSIGDAYVLDYLNQPHDGSLQFPTYAAPFWHAGAIGPTFRFTRSSTPTPEPGSLALLGIAFAPLVVRTRRKGS